LPGCAVTVFSVFWRTRGFSSGQTLLSCCRGAQETVASTGSSHRTNKWFGYLPCGHGFMECRFAHHVDEFGDGRHQSLPGLNYYLSLHELGCDGPVNLTVRVSYWVVERLAKVAVWQTIHAVSSEVRSWPVTLISLLPNCACTRAQGWYVALGSSH
jgi:hypothetical protein